MGEEHHSPSPSHDMKDLNEVTPAKQELSQAERAALEGTVWRKLDRWTLPLCSAFFLLAALDKTNVGNASVAGMQSSLAMSSYQYTIAVTVTYVPYVFIEFPSTLVFKYIGPDLMLPAMAASWGVVSASQGLVNNYSGLLACRFFLGLIEGGVLPGIILYLSFFYPRKMLHMRIAIFFASTSLAGAFSGLLAASIDQINVAGRPGWAWIFILEGVLTFLFGVMSFFLLPCSPEKARFLTERERAYVVSRLKRTGSVSEDDNKDRFSWKEVIRALQSLHVWLITIVFFFSGAISFGLAYFEPTIVASLGYAGNRAQLMSVPPFAASFLLSLISAIVSDRYQCRGPTVIFFSLLQVIGFAMFYSSTSSHVRYVSLFFSISGAFCSLPASMTWLANNSAPHTRRATALAVASIMAQVGGILTTWLIGWLSPAPDYTTVSILFIAMSVGTVVLSTVNLAYLWRENRLKAERKEKMKKEEEPEGLGDRSAWFKYSL